MAKYPVNLNISGSKVVVIGAGSVAARKIPPLVDAGPDVTVISKSFDQSFDKTLKDTNIKKIETPYESKYIKDALLVIAATDNEVLNKQIYTDCKNAKVLCNVVDVPDLCDFYVPAVVNRSSLQIAIGTDGKCPAYAARIRKKLQEIITDDHGRFLDELAQTRKKVIAEIPSKNRKALMTELAGDESFEIFLTHGPDEWHKWADKITSA